MKTASKACDAESDHRELTPVRRRERRQQRAQAAENLHRDFFKNLLTCC
nr:MAG TPA: hypothetical protein [Caudoviricetes sp.]DAW98879.1 MAG TPA: hypothetical protein [Bacteriophage sp.]